MSLRLYSHPACFAHNTGEGHAERPERLRAVIEAVSAAFPQHVWHEAPAASRADLLRAHEAGHVAALLDRDWPEAAYLDPDTVCGPGSIEAALRAAGAVIAATDWVLAGHGERAFCAVRPPGHHATRDTAMGFCLFNNVAIGALHALATRQVSRVAIADFDVHHGNGTQAIFEREPRMLFASSHELPLYPNTGGADETGVGNVFNAPLLAGSGSEDFRAVWSRQLLPAIADFAPEIVFISAGFDAHRDDPLANLQVLPDDFAWLTERLCRIADASACGRVVSTLEGGYDLDALAASAVAHVRALAT